ncbi:hypothetical protein [Frondihabitans sp. PAMC 28766]|uniref:hypothetical protein n=1 Tax=Frondihabitans sp. PAMC 28766 TaxID=1795630 RepID=UPI0012FFA6D8|nr:hypothetical protein [Frondihabitans sp. PAMC 28766]
MFIDETKAREYLLVAAIIPSHGTDRARQAMRTLLLRGQPRVHMKKESDSRRRKVLSVIAEIQPLVVIYRAGAPHRTDLIRREKCLRAIARDLLADGETHLFIETDETLIRRDRQCLVDALHGAAPTATYEHRTAAAEPLLSIPDAVAWAWARGGDWRRRIEGVVHTAVDV